MKTYLNLDGVECVFIENKDGTFWSGLKSAYDVWVAEGNTAEEWSPDASE